MNTSLPRLLSALHIALIAVISAGAGHWADAQADDTELFFSPVGLGGSGGANVMLILDSSTSMRTRLSFTETRADLLREAARELLTSLAGVDVGLTTYNHRGASVIAPIRPLDEPATGVNRLVARVNKAENDAGLYGERTPQSVFDIPFGFPDSNVNEPLGTVYSAPVNNLPIQRIDTNTAPASVRIEIDAEVISFPVRPHPSVGSILDPIINPSTLDIPGMPGATYAPLVTHFDGTDNVGVVTQMRFDLRDAGAQFNNLRTGCIQEAYVEMNTVSPQSDADFSSRLSIATTINSTTTPVASLPTSGASSALQSEYGGSFVGANNFNGGTPRGAGQRWDAIPSADTFRTPDLSGVLQESLATGASFANASTGDDHFWIAFDPRRELRVLSAVIAAYELPTGFIDNPPPTREIFSTGSGALAPKLVIVVSPPTLNNMGCRSTVVSGKYMLGALFEDMRIPKNATITAARLYLSPAADYLSSEGFRMNVYVAGVADPVAHTGAPGGEFSSWINTPANLSANSHAVWVDPGRSEPELGALASSRTSAGPWNAAGQIASPDLSAVVQAAVGRTGWCGGQALAVYVEPRRLDSMTAEPNPDPNAPALSTAAATTEQRSFHMFESSPALAPRLEVSFTYPPPGSPEASDACNIYDINVGIPPVGAGQSDDIRYTRISDCFSRGPSLYIQSLAQRTVQINSMTFRDLPIPPGSEILSANIVFSNARRLNTNQAELSPRRMVLRGHIPPTAADVLAPGEPMTNQREGSRCLLDHIRQNESGMGSMGRVTWDMGRFVTERWNDPMDPLLGNITNVPRQTPDITAILQPVVSNAVWATDPDFTVVFFAGGGNVPPGSSTRRLRVGFQLSAGITDGEPRLVASFRTNQSPDSSILTHRQRLIEIIDGMEFSNRVTPFFSPLREAVTYFRNEEVYAGRKRAPSGADPNVTRPEVPRPALETLRISDAATHDGSIVYPADCRSNFLSSADCYDIALTPGATYKTTGVTGSCESNHIVLLSDGNPTAYGAGQAPVFEAWVDSLAPGYTCGNQHTCPNEPFMSADAVQESQYINRLAAYVSSNSFTSPNNLENEEPIRIHTIGFSVGGNSMANQEARAVLESLAENGDGDFYVSDDAASLLFSLRQIFGSLGVSNASLSAPSLTINAFNSLFTLDEIYVSMFLPEADQISWSGNIKKYRLRATCPADTNPMPTPDCAGITPSNTDCTVGELLDACDRKVLLPNQSVSPTARSFWNTADDGSIVTEGGAGAVRLRSSSQTLLTDAGNSTPTNSPGGNAHPSSFFYPPMTIRANLLVEEYSIHTTNKMNLEPFLAPTVQSDSDKLINWWRGIDSFDEDEDGVTSDRRWPIQDSLHTNIVPVIFGLDTLTMNPVLKLFSTTNAGEIRMINGENGEEEWRYVPRDQLTKAVQLAEPQNADLSGNPNATRLYGLDGPLSSITFDCNRNGIIEPGPEPTASDCGSLSSEVGRDRVLLFATQRRGGDKIYAIEAEPLSVISQADPIGDIAPVFLWSIDSSTPGYSHLGQTWSQAVPMRIFAQQGNSGANFGLFNSRLVVGFAAGYDSRNDVVSDRNAPQAQDTDTTPGLSGGAIYMADMFTGACVVHIGPVVQPDCEYSTAVPEMKYSIPMTPGFLNSTLQPRTPARRGVDRIYFTDLGGQVFRADLDANRVASDDEYVRVNKIADLGQARSGSAPKDRRQFYNAPIVVPVRGDTTFSTTPDYDLVLLASGNRPFPRSSGVEERAYVLRDTNATSVYGPSDVIPILTESDLVDTTTALPTVGSLRPSSGFYFNFDNPANLEGQKAISQGVVLAGTWFLTSYSPEEVSQVGLCTAGRGVSRFLAINILDASPTIDQNGDGLIDIDDRASTVGAGVVSDIATAFLEGGTALLVNTEGGSRTLDTGGALSNLDIPVVQSRREW